MNLLSGYRSGSVGAQKIISELSMRQILPVLRDIWLTRVHESVDIYVIFRFDPMHCLQLGVSKHLEVCFINRPFFPKKSSCSITLSSRKKKTFPVMKKQVFKQFNRFSKTFELPASGAQSHIDFRKGECERRHSAFLTENGIPGKTEEADDESVSIIFHFLANSQTDYEEKQTSSL